MLLKKYTVSISNTVKSGHTYMQWLITLLSSSTFLGYGFQTGWVSPMKKILQSDASPTGKALSDLEMSCVASTATLAAVIATPICMYLAESYGRKTAILTITFVNALSWILKLVAIHISVLIIARVCSGFVLGGCYCLIPMYVREISQDSIKGKMVSLAILMQHVGVLAMYALGSYLEYYTSSWILLSISLVTLLLMILAPESPVFLVKKGKDDVASRTLATLRGLNIDDIDVQNEINHMKNEDAYYKSVEQITFVAIYKNKAWRRGFILCQILTICVAFNGTFGIVTYAWSIMKEAGVSFSPELLSLMVPLLMMSSAIVSIACVEKTGRKLLLAGAYMLSAVSLTCLASALLAQRSGAAVPGWVLVVTIAVTVSAYSAGVLPMPNVIMNDIFKFQIRAKLIGCIQVVIWGILSLQVIFFDLVSSALGLHSVFYVCAGVNLLGAVVVLAFVPETKGRTTDQIEAILARKSDSTAINSS
ncbi:hypothetical protein ABMA27_013487 [Loxostege sticticalis]|uniref:Major facilitator superfamily (MFS) profile domain-containing protein n=1 Tax=Loxostege sticticalis TaxID=481309 RepID=A0ABR3IFG2_LOXSC